MFTEGHLDGDVLELYAMGRLSEAASEPLEEHILVCEICQQRLTETEAYIRAMRGALSKSADHEQTHPFLSRLRDLFLTPKLSWSPVTWGSVALAVCAAAIFLGSTLMRREWPPVAVALSAMRGAGAAVRARGPLDLDLDTSGLPAAEYRVEIVDALGKSVWKTAHVPAQSDHVRVRVERRLGGGQYFIRAILPDGSTAREYSLEVQ